MKHLSLATTRIMEKICSGLTKVGDHKKLDNKPGSFLPLHVEVIGKVKAGSTDDAVIISMAHYVNQNGDACRDPEMEFIRCTLKEMDKKTYQMKNQVRYFPISCRNDLVGSNHRYIDMNEDGSFEMYNSSINDRCGFCSFVNIWAKNIKVQQGL
jgi:hypothetical protein